MVNHNSTNMSKIPMALEAIWLVLALLCMAIGIHSTIKIGIAQSYMFFILSAVAVLMYLLRRYRRKNYSSDKNI
jgi:membrane protein implicated in regulation of membrane protease activity